MSKRTSNIASAMREAASSTRSAPITTSSTKNASGRIGTKAVTGHFPPEVRHQLKILAAEQDRTMESLLAEGLNMLFSAYNKPEIAPTGPTDRSPMT